MLGDKRTQLPPAAIPLLPRLTPREEQVLRLYYGIEEFPLEMPEIARRFQVSTQRMSQIRLRALHKLLWLLAETSP